MGALSHDNITYQNDNSDTKNRQVTPALPKNRVRYNHY